MPPITINCNTIIPDNARGLLPPDASNTNYILIQTDHRLLGTESLQLAAKHVQVLSLAAQSNDDTALTYLCFYPKSDLATLADLPFVLHALVYHDDFVVAPELREANWDRDEPGPGIHMAKPRTSRAGSKLVEIVVSLHQDHEQAGAEAVYNSIAGMLPEGSSDVQQLYCGPNQLNLLVHPTLIKRIASLEHVVAINPARRAYLCTRKQRELVKFPWSGWLGLDGGRFQGSGQVVAVMDTGFDVAKWVVEPPVAAVDPHPASIRSRAPSLVQRIANKSNHLNGVYPTHPDLLLHDENGHGTHVAGIISSQYYDPLVYSPDFTHIEGSNGMAPEAKIYVTRFFPEDSMTGQVPPVVKHITSQLMGITIMNCSWGRSGPMEPDVSGAYMGSSADEADTETYKNPDLLLNFAAANDGGELCYHTTYAKTNPINRQINGPAQAKNVLTVGATWSDRYMGPRFIPTAASPQTPSDCEEGRLPADVDRTPPKIIGKEIPRSVATFSNKGPTWDDLLKPDVVAPGVGILSTASRHPEAQAAHRNGPKDPNTFQHNGPFTFDSGTSMAAACVSGLAACIKEGAIATTGFAPTGISIKAIIVNGAISCEGSIFNWIITPWISSTIPEVRGRGTLRKPPDTVQGFGEASYPRSILHVTQSALPPGIQPPNFAGYSEHKFALSGSRSSSSVIKEIAPRTGDKQGCATLCWYEPAGGLVQVEFDFFIYIEEPGSTAPRTEYKPPVIIENYSDLYRSSDNNSNPQVKYGCTKKIWFKLAKDGLKVTLSVSARAVTSVRTVNFSLAWLTEP